MNTDYLIAKYLDGTISGEEQILLDDTIAKNPELKDEIEAMKAIDNKLAEPFNLNHNDSKVIAATFDKVAAAYFTGAAVVTGAAVTSGKFASIVSSISSGFVATSLGVVAVASTLGYFIYENNNKTNTPAPAKIEQVQTPIEKLIEAEPAKVEVSASIEKKEIVPIATKVEKKIAAIPSQPILLSSNTEVKKAPKELDASAKVVSNNQDDKDLVRTTKDELNLALSQGNNTKAAYLYKKMGLLQKQSSVENSANSLAKALELAKSTSNKELEAECYGELALIDFSRGSAVAQDRAKLCLDILGGLNSAKLSNWKSKLSRIK